MDTSNPDKHLSIQCLAALQITRRLCLAAITTFLASHLLAQSPQISIVAFEQSRIAGLQEDEILQNWDLAKGINQQGTVVFTGNISRKNTNGNWFQSGKGLWTGKPGSIEMVMREGEAIPGEDAELKFFELLEPISFNNRGEIAFFASIRPTNGSKRTALFVWKSGSIRMVAKDGDPAIGFEMINGKLEFKTEFNLSTSARISLSDTGELAWSSAVQGTNTEVWGVWFTNTDTTRIISPVSAEHEKGHFPALTIGTDGAVAFIEKGAVDSLYFWKDATLTTVAREDNKIEDSNSHWRLFSQPVLQDNGTLVFGAQTRGETKSRNDSAIWHWKDGQLKEVAISQTILVPDQLISRAISLHSVVSASGLVTYSACGEAPVRPRPTCQTVILVDDETGARIVAYEGMPFPGAPEGSTITFKNVRGLSDHSLVSNERRTKIMHLGQKSSEGEVGHGVYSIKEMGYSPILEAGEILNLGDETGAKTSGFHIYADNSPTTPFRSINNNNELLLTISSEELPNALAIVKVDNPSPISIKNTAEGIILTWNGDGILEAAIQLQGPWSQTPNQDLSQQISTSQSIQFFRIR